jgi:hypothetical protein
VAPVEITLTQTSALALLCPESIESRPAAHRVKAGNSAVWGTSVSAASQQIGNDQREIGGVRLARPRTTDLTINVQQPFGVYGHPSLISTSVFAAKGSLMAKPFASAAVAASGVPPRGRPV